MSQVNPQQHVTITEARLFETEVGLFGWLNCELFRLVSYEKPLRF
jgi:hypothetical protein